MQIHGDKDERDTEPGLTTEDLAHPGGAGADAAPAYPGEATRDDDERFGGGETRDDRLGTGETRDEGLGTGETRDEGLGTAETTDTTAAQTRDEDLGTDATSTETTATATDTGADQTTGEAADDSQPLLGAQEAEEYRQAWSDIQGRFVDDPQAAVRSADTLVAEVMQTLAGTFASHKQGLEGQWDRGEQVATEDLRLALQHYRSFFNRLLKT
ncbi:hypothetical protein ACF059_05260 [Streptomyces sp. NPDC016562]|uniref:hypothetical protein n=1 Tax=Streptomyces sp. NPDC016562 TaxID=3364966 RepID=UPI0036FAB38C